MRFEQITATVVRSFVNVEVRANFVVTSVLAAAVRLSDWLRKPLGTPAVHGFHDPSSLHSPIQRILQAMGCGSLIHECFDDTGNKRLIMSGRLAMVCATSSVPDRRSGAGSY